MRLQSLHARLILWIGLGLAVLWLAVAGVTVHLMRGQIDRSADAMLAATAQRLLPLLANDTRRGGLGDRTRRMLPRSTPDERYSYIVTDAQGNVLLRSYETDVDDFPARRPRGFVDFKDRRVFHAQTPGGRVHIMVAEAKAQRDRMARRVYMSMIWPLLVLIPLSFGVVWLVLRRALGPVRDLGAQIARRDVGGLTAIDVPDLPSELTPVADAVNDLIARLDRAFEAERAFAANAAHELRTPIAAAQAHIQRLQAQAKDAAISGHADEAVHALQRLARLSQKLMQLTRAEGGRLRVEKPMAVRPIVQMIVQDVARDQQEAIDISEPDGPVLTHMDPDIYGILAANLIENAMRYGDPDTQIKVTMRPGLIQVCNSCAPLGPATLQRICGRFERGTQDASGAGLGLSIVRAIAQGVGGKMQVRSPIAGTDRGFEVMVTGLG